MPVGVPLFAGSDVSEAGNLARRFAQEAALIKPRSALDIADVIALHVRVPPGHGESNRVNGDSSGAAQVSHHILRVALLRHA